VNEGNMFTSFLMRHRGLFMAEKEVFTLNQLLLLLTPLPASGLLTRTQS